MSLSNPEILSRVNDIWSDAWGSPTDSELQARRRGGAHFVALHRLVADAGGTQPVIDACTAAGLMEAEEAGLPTAPGAINWTNILQIVMQIMAAIAATKPPVPAKT